MNRWSDLHPRIRRILLALGAADVVLRIVALVDLARRPAEQVNGRKSLWALSLSVANSLGIVPICYLTRGRRPALTRGHEAASRARRR
ncbi:DUF5652 family protein [Aestuariimicrobium ganziense]|uniref:DUF5652 family protein n=1 Tax=Aestuariimicrobium ganziense TaxID=2773677 RepID=UPI0019408E5D|nr:DUF5652 family protein [Aestuariimicrobium ganziense]